MAKPQFSIVIPARNTIQSLQMVLDCLERQQAPSDLAEILIVDDGSTDGTRAWLQRYASHFQFRCWFNTASQGRSAARNRAWKEAEGDIILFLDADMLTEPNWLQGFADAFAGSHCDVISGGRHHVDLGTDPAHIRMRLAERLQAAPDRLFAPEGEAPWNALQQIAAGGQYPSSASRKFEEQLRAVCRDFPASLICAYSLVTSNVGVRRERLEQANGFDPFMARGEDTDIGMRLWEQGARFGYAAAANAYHLYTTAGRDRAADFVRYAAWFHRYPYLPVAWIYLWFVYNESEALATPPPQIDSLWTLAQQGEALMEVDVAREFARLNQGRLFADCRFTKEAVAAYLVETADIGPGKAGDLIDLALQHGLCAQRRNGRVYLDILHTTNWLCHHTPFQQHVKKHLSYGFNHRTPYFQTRDREDLLTLSWHGSYEISINARALSATTTRIGINIPVPIETAGQTHVEIVDCYPHDLLDHYDATTGVIRNYQATTSEDGTIVVRYSFTCKTHEQSVGEVTTAEAGDAIRAEDLKVTYPPGTLSDLQALLYRIQVAPDASPAEAAHKIYLYLLDNVRSLQTLLPDYCILVTGLGPCLHWVRLFINLCRRLHIPARERCGALLDGVFNQSHDLQNPRLLTTRLRGFSPFLHTWAEFYDRSAVGHRSNRWRRTTVNDLFRCGICRRRQCETGCRRKHPPVTPYYFGTVDPYRIHCGADINRLPALPVLSVGAEPIPMYKLWWHTRHHLKAEFEALPPDATPAARRSST